MDDIVFPPKLLPPEEGVAHIKDTETCGLQGGICEFAFVKIDFNLNILDQQRYLVKPDRPIHPEATKIHGITDDMVANCPTIAEIADQHGFLTRSVNFIAHNAEFDKRMLKEVVTADSTLCSLALSRQYIKGTTNHKLETLQRELNMPKRDSHSALGDVLSVLDLLHIILPMTGVDLKTLFLRASLPKMLLTMPFGVHKGKKFAQVPRQYRQWLAAKTDLPADLSYTLGKYANL